MLLICQLQQSKRCLWLQVFQTSVVVIIIENLKQLIAKFTRNIVIKRVQFAVSPDAQLLKR